MRIFALSEWRDLQAATKRLDAVPFVYLRKPETGLVMMRGRMGATGAPFNLGEATVTRCAVVSEQREGHGYVLGRNAAHARTIAMLDALLQSPDHAPWVRDEVLPQLSGKIGAARVETAGKAAATKVEFFTMVRGDD